VVPAGGGVGVMKEQYGRSLRILLAVCALVLLIACANVANLLLARAAGRGPELAVRAALGAGRARLARQLVTEALLLAVLGCGAGLVLAWASRPLLLALWPASLPPLETPRLSAAVTALSVLAALACAAAVSLVPARVAARASALASLRGSGRAPTSGPRAARVRGLIVVAEVALAVVLVSGAGLLLGTLARLQRAPLGFRAEGALTARLDLPRALGKDAPGLRAFALALEERLRALPGVEGAALGQALPLSGTRTSAGLRIEGRAVEPNASLDTCWRLVSPDWHDTLGVPLLRGRRFAASDARTAPPVALVNATLARAVFAGEDPIGRRIATGLDGPEGTWVTIVGVVADTPQETAARAARPEMYRPLTQDVRMGPAGLALVVRGAGDLLGLAPALRREVAALRGDVAVSRVVPLSGLVSDTLAAPRAAAGVLGLFAFLALLLAALGLYGVVACLVSETTRDLGVRLALGARPASLVAHVLRRTLSLAALGLLAGIGAALAVGRLLEGLLFGISPSDPLTLAVVALVLLAAAAAAGYGPARRAARLDPARVLRAE
jgi:predicted permease